MNISLILNPHYTLGQSEQSLPDAPILIIPFSTNLVNSCSQSKITDIRK